MRVSGVTTLELPTSTPQMVDALSLDRLALRRDVMRWQRPIRLAILVAILGLALSLGTEDHARTIPMALGISAAYVALVLFGASAAGREAARGTRWPAIQATADILTIAALVWSAGAPAESALMLVPALLVVQFGAYYHGRSLGTWCAVLAASSYLLVAQVLPSWMPGPRESLRHTVLTAAMFALASVLLIVAHAGFRARMDHLRLFCRLVEEGDLAPTVPLGTDRRPDDLTLLARSFDAMRTRLAEQIGTDPLTGCLNRRALETRLRSEWRQAKRRGTTVAVLAIDIDHFKQINDTRGHPVGDVVLQEIASIFKATARDTDAVARLGGDEFVVVLPDTGWQGALTFAERMRRKVEEFAFGADTGTVRLTISLGVALARGTDPVSPDVLLQEADRSLYKAKSGGRNRIFA
jgi:diguanylate cyclase (GGDEF)-like protein